MPNQFQEDEIPLAVMAGRIKKLSENTSTIPEVMDCSMLNFKANFKFSRFLFGEDTFTSPEVIESNRLIFRPLF